MHREKGSCHKGDRSSNMGEEYLVYPDRIKQFTAFFMNLILIVVCCCFIYMDEIFSRNHDHIHGSHGRKDDSADGEERGFISIGPERNYRLYESG